MENLFRTKKLAYRLSLFISLLSVLLSVSSPATSQTPSIKLLAPQFQEALEKTIPCKKVEVQIEPSREKPTLLKRLVVKLDGVPLGHMTADHMTLIYEDPVIDLVRLSRLKEPNLQSYSKNRASILISEKSIERYLEKRARELKRKYNAVSIKFAPPFVECRFDVPVSEISPETMKLLEKFVKKSRLEGYAAFQIKAKDNALYAFSSKVIVNHFLIPDFILKEFQTKFNPFDGIPPIKPFHYSLNSVTVQNKYLFLTN